LKSLLFSVLYFTIFKPFKKFKSRDSKSTNFNNLFLNALQIKLIGSNHYRRRNIGFNFIGKIISQLFFWRCIRNNSLIYLLRKNPIRQYKADFLCNNDQKNFFDDQIIFCGDSHVEFLSRINFVGYLGKKISPISVWLGPRTLTGVASDIKIQNWLYEIICRVQNFKEEKNIYIIFSIGSIDIRTSIGYLLKNKIISSENEFFDFFERSYIAFYEIMLEKLKEKRKIKIAFLSIPPVSPLNGVDIKKSAKKNNLEYQNNFKFKIFGSPKERGLWAKALNQRLEKLSNQKGWNFINNYKAYENIEFKNNYIINKKSSFDNIHLSDAKLYAETLKNIISYFEDKN
jgi:hypothetical protein